MSAIQRGRCHRALISLVAGTGSACFAAPPNDDCAAAIEITAGATVFTLDGATATGSLATCAAAGVARDVWYRFTPATSDIISMSICNNFQAITATVYAGICGTFAQPLNPAGWTDIPASNPSIAVLAGDATFHWTLSGYTDTAGTVFEIRPVIGASLGTPMRRTFNVSAIHLSTAGTSVATISTASTITKLQVRRVFGTGGLFIDANDSLSWTLTVFKTPSP